MHQHSIKMPLLSQVPAFNMCKRKLVDDLPIFCKRAKLANVLTPPSQRVSIIDLLPTPPPSPVALALRHKRKRLDEAEADIDRTPKARRTEPITFCAVQRPRQPHAPTSRSKRTTLSRSPAASSEVPGGRWDRLTARLTPQLTAPSRPTPALGRETLIKRKDEKKIKVKSSCKATKAALVPRPARLKNQLPSPANTPRKKKASVQVEKRKVNRQEGRGGQRRPRVQNPTAHLNDSIPKAHSRAGIIRQMVDLMQGDNLLWPEEVIR